MRTILLAAAAALLAAPALAQQAPDFGADTSAWANDGECDDPRFAGQGMAATLIDADIMADASDCRALFEAGSIRLAGAAPTTPTTPGVPAPTAGGTPDFGTDTSTWANDGECDDPRFQGAGMASGPLSQADTMADASDCASAFLQGTIDLVGAAAPGVPATAPGGKPAQEPGPPTTAPALPTVAPGSIDFGNDSSEWAMDGECDDRRFVGQGMALSLGWQNVGRDATDCRSMYEAGALRLWDWTEALAATQCASVDFGDDTGEYASDGECDDMRFEGLAMAGGVGEAHVLHDASDCQQACAMGVVALRDY